MSDVKYFMSNEIIGAIILSTYFLKAKNLVVSTTNVKCKTVFIKMDLVQVA